MSSPASPRASGGASPQFGGAPPSGGNAHPGFAALDQNDWNVPRFYAAAMAGLIVLFTIFHFTRFLYSRYASKSVKESAVMKIQVSIARIFRKVLLRRVPLLASVAQAQVVFVYLAINIILTVTNTPFSPIIGMAKRLGWMAVTNIAFITFLALKNTPLAYLTSYSYDRLNILHQVGGYTTVTYVFLHAIVMTNWKNVEHSLNSLLQENNVGGIVAACAMLVILITAVLIKKIRYEIFYVTHIIMYMLILIMVGLHRPRFADKTVIIIIFSATIWSSDRILRGCRILWYSYGNRATVTPLGNGGTRIVLRKSPARAVPGAHCFLWVPRIRAFESHPFTIVSATPYSLELVIAAYDGFTNDLHAYSINNPGVSLRASIDGPYGAVPDFARTADKIILVAGGSGASFTFGLALDIIRKIGDSRIFSIEFIWAVKDQDLLSWFSKELFELRASPNVNVNLYSTRSPYPTILQNPTNTPPTPPSPSEKETFSPPQAHSTSSPTQPIRSQEADIEKHSESSLPSTAKENTYSTSWESPSSLGITIRSGRPDIPSLIKEVVRNTNNGERIAIGACGPESLMGAVRDTAAVSITIGGPSIELHTEQFGW